MLYPTRSNRNEILLLVHTVLNTEICFPARVVIKLRMIYDSKNRTALTNQNAR